MSLYGIKTTESVRKMRLFLKMLTCDYYTFQIRAKYQGESIREGWRWFEGAIKYTKEWEEEDVAKCVSPEERTKRVLQGTMQGVEEYLEFTVESGEEFTDGWLPTLDLSLKVGEDNKIQYRFFEKDTCSQEAQLHHGATGGGGEEQGG